jgi:ketosteroid isomerase-like protein
MKGVYLLQFTLVLVTAAMGCAPADDSPSSADQGVCTLTSADIEAIHGMRAIHEAEVLAADWEAMMASLSPDVVVMPPNQAEITGREPLLAYLKTYPPITEFEQTFEEVDGCGDLAYVRGRYSMAMQSAGSAELVPDTGRWIWILRKNPEGRWVVARDIIFSSDQPLATGK